MLEEEKFEEEVRTRLTRAAADWNQGDLDRFLSIYHGSETTALFTSTEVFQGLKAIRRAYERSFTGHLSLQVAEVLCFAQSPQPLAYIVAKLDLESNRAVRSAHCSLLLKRIHERWYVVKAVIPELL